AVELGLEVPVEVQLQRPGVPTAPQLTVVVEIGRLGEGQPYQVLRTVVEQRQHVAPAGDAPGALKVVVEAVRRREGGALHHVAMEVDSRLPIPRHPARLVPGW